MLGFLIIDGMDKVDIVGGLTWVEFRGIVEFRNMPVEGFKGLLSQVLYTSQGSGLVKLGCGALDRTKLKASASLHMTVSCGPMDRTRRGGEWQTSRRDGT